MPKRKKTQNIVEEKPPIDEKTLLFKELMDTAIDISLCDPEKDKDQLNELIKRLRRIIREIRRQMRNG
ncbi:hypothetical protein DRN98_09400 [Methanosarcinales archaeon]|nr:MAG: hypothetical protein DRN98_09400 [Methanosarcinales archaeon]